MRWSAAALGRATSCRMQSTGEREKEGAYWLVDPVGNGLDVTYVWEARIGE